MQHLDGAGAAALASLLRTLPQSTILLIAQRTSAAAEAAQNLDLVVKRNGASTVLLGTGGRMDVAVEEQGKAGQATQSWEAV